MLPLYHGHNSDSKSAHQIARLRLGRRIVLCVGFLSCVWLFVRLWSDPPPPNFPKYPPPGPATVWTERAGQVRQAYIHAYSGYLKQAAPYDELLPVSGGKLNTFNGWRLSMIDSLDTMWIMGLHKEFKRATRVVAKQKFLLKPSEYAPFYETTVRYVGGLLSAYALSGQPMLLARADNLGRMMLPAFNTSSGFPMSSVNPQTGETRTGWTEGPVLLSEMLSCQMEYKYLAHLTGHSEYYRKVENIMSRLYTTNFTDGLLPTMWEAKHGTPINSHYTVGAFADSSYEYLLKQWLLTGKSNTKARDQYVKSVNGILNNLLFVTPKRKLIYATDIHLGRPNNLFEQLSCSFPGLLALGVHTLDLSPRDKELHGWAARGLAYTCWMTYADQATGLGPEEMTVDTRGGKWMGHVEKWNAEGRLGGVPPGLQEVDKVVNGHRDYANRKRPHLLRPEVVESFFVLWKTTGDKVWRERGWAVFEAIEKETRTPYGYASIANVDLSPSPKKDEMPSYFLAETLKYLYLLFSDIDIIPLDKWVFNTQGHPFPIFHWSDAEKHEYHIP